MQDSNAQTHTTSMSPADQVAAVASLLSGKPAAETHHAEEKQEDLRLEGRDDEPPPEQPYDDTEYDEGSPDAPPEKKDSAKYDAKMEVTLAGTDENGEKVTVKLGELKDFYQKYKPQQRDELQIIERENKTMRDLGQLREMAVKLGVLPEAEVQAYHQEKQHQRNNERLALLDALPALRDPEKFKAADAAMTRLARDYALPPDVDPTASHQWLKLVHDYAMLRERMRAAQANVKPARPREPNGKPRSHASSRSNIEQLTATAQRTKNIRDQTAAVTALLLNS